MFGLKPRLDRCQPVCPGESTMSRGAPSPTLCQWVLWASLSAVHSHRDVLLFRVSQGRRRRLCGSAGRKACQEEPNHGLRQGPLHAALTIGSPSLGEPEIGHGRELLEGGAV